MADYDFIILGAGVMGCSTAYYLSKENNKVLLVDQFKVKNEQNTSQDYSRALRFEYGDDEYYSKLVLESLKLWKDIEEQASKQLFFRCGALLLATSKEGLAFRGYETLRKLQFDVELLDRGELNDRFPQFNAEFGILDKNAGVLSASSCVDSLLRLSKDNGVKVLENTKVIGINEDNIILENGSQIPFNKKVIVTTGIWCKELLDLPIEVTKQELVYLKPSFEENFIKENFPMFGHMDSGFYGFPIHEIDSIKIANHYPSKSTSDNVDSEFIRSCQEFFKEFIPSLENSEIINTKVCFYDRTPDEDFIIDNYNDNLVVGCGFSGHGFKFAPLMGKVLSELALDKSVSYDISRFKLKRFSSSS